MYRTTSFYIGITLIALVHSKVTPDISCSSASLDVRVNSEGIEKVELKKWSQIPGCETRLDRDSFFISLKLNGELPCGTTKIKNKLTGQTLYYHQLLITEIGGSKHLYKISCFLSPHDDRKSNIVKRNVLPAEFMEPDFIELTSEVSGVAPIPELSVGVRQSGNLIGDQITVSPGAPLIMEVYLDNESSSTYGILVSYMIVSDTTDKNETIIYNGCTQDRYVFENFQTNDGDFLTAKFRAFKFPESNYLLFRGTVDVCLDRCEGIRCSNGEIGYGRKRRALPIESADPNRIFEVTMMTFVKVGEEKYLENEETSLMGLERIITKSDDPTVTFREEEEVLVSRRSHGEQPPFIFFERNSAESSFHRMVTLICTTLYFSLQINRMW